METTEKDQIKKRIAIERRIVSCVVKEALRNKLTISVWEGGAFCLKKSSSYRSVMSAIMSTDSDEFRLRNEAGDIVGWVQFIYGNGADVLTNSSDNELTKRILKPAEDLAESLQ